MVAVTLSDRYDLALTMAASLFALLPAVLIFAFGQKYLEQGILAGAVKG